MNLAAARKKTPIIIPLILLALLALLAGLWAGLLRLGWVLPGLHGPLPMEHGPLMVSGFLGTLIALERVVAIRRRWMFLAPVFSGLGWAVSLAFPTFFEGSLLITLGSLVFVGILLVMIRREKQPHTLVMGLGAFSWLVGNLFWFAGWPVSRFVFWWVAFLVLTVAGERLELSRVLRPTRQQHRLFGFTTVLFMSGVTLSIFNLDAGTRLAGIGLFLMAAWLLKFDLARRNLRHPVRLTRYIAVCLFAGYVWLGFAGLLSFINGGQMAGALYDAMLHSVFLGFIFSMIFGHMPIILPALTGMMLAFSPLFYSYLVLLHGALLLRVAGDLMGISCARQWGGMLNEVAILAFLIGTIVGVISARRKAA